MCTKTSSQMGTSQMTRGCWSLLEISQELAGVCWSLLEALERYLEVTGGFWRCWDRPLVFAVGDIS